MDGESISPIRFMPPGTSNSSQKESATGWSNSMPLQRVAFSSIPNFSSKRKNIGCTRFAWKAATLRQTRIAFREANGHAAAADLRSGFKAVSMTDIWPWVVLFGLGAFHGINPGMGWLFAVCLGLQERRRKAVLAALPPIALGHALSVGLVVALIAVLRTNLRPRVLKYSAAAILILYGLFRLVRARHPRWVGMRVGLGDLTLWSFLMASAHG